jgi:hypothetical protein
VHLEMALTDRELLLEEEVIIFEDAEVGKRVSELKQKRFPFQTEEGLEFRRVSTIKDDASTAIEFGDSIS